MAPPPIPMLVLVLFHLFLLSSSLSVSAASQTQTPQILLGRRTLLTKTLKEVQAAPLPKMKKVPKPDADDHHKSPKKKTTDEEEEEQEGSAKKDEKLIKSKITSSKNQTKLIKPTKNQTKLIKTTSSKPIPPNLTKTKLNSTSNTESSDPNKPKTVSIDKTKKKEQQKPPTSWMYSADIEDLDFVSEFRDLPIKFHQTFIPDLHRISATSQNYLNKANKDLTKGFKPYVGNKYAPSVATAICIAFIIVPLLLVSLLFNKIKAYFSLQRLLIFIQIYLSIYFSILSLSSVLTGLEPLRFFYATSQSTYVWVQVLQTLGYVLYLLLLLMYLILVFSTETNLGQKFLGLAQTFVGFSVGLHYYMTVFHRVVLRQPPKTNWKVHGIYATCFLVICLFARAERRKKAYLVEGGEEGKMN